MTSRAVASFQRAPLRFMRTVKRRRVVPSHLPIADVALDRTSTGKRNHGRVLRANSGRLRIEVQSSAVFAVSGGAGQGYSGRELETYFALASERF
jgi:hypothetical protein